MKFRFEIGQTRENDAGDIDFVIGDETLHRRFRHFANVIVSFLHSKSSETQRTLTSASVFLRQIDAEFRDHFARVALQCAEQRTVAVHDDETEARIVGEQRL